MNFALLVIQVWIMAASALLLHRLSPRFGLTPLLFYVAALVALLNIIEPLALEVEIVSGLVFRTGGHVFVPIILLIVLILYIANGTRPTQIIIYGLGSINLLVIVILVFLALYANVGNTTSLMDGRLQANDVFNFHFIRGILASLVAFMVDMFVITIAYQGIRNTYPDLTRWAASCVALLIALWTDSVVFNVLFYIGTSDYTRLIPGDIIAKCISGLLIWLPLAYYLNQIAPRLPGFKGVVGRPTLDILFGSFEALNETLQLLQSELYVSRLTYEQLTEHIDEVFWLADLERQRFVYISPAFERLTGYAADTFYPDPNLILDLIHPDDRNFSEGSLIDFLMSAQVNEFRLLATDGTYHWFRNRPFAIENTNGIAYRYAGIAIDVTSEKLRQEQELQLAIADQKMRVLHDFIRDASHDLKTPLNSIILKADMLSRVADEEARQRMRNELKERAHHLTDLIDDLFALSRIEGYDTEEQVEMNLHDAIEEINKVMQPMIVDKGLDYRVELIPKPLLILANVDQIDRVITNLVSNALRYTQSGSVMIRTWEEENVVAMSVADSGIGIAVADLPHIFKRFYRSENAKAKTSGTGLGLAIVMAIVDKHKGSVDVTSTEGQGTIFTIKFPKLQTIMSDNHNAINA